MMFQCQMFSSINDMFTMFFFITFWPSDSQLLAGSPSLNTPLEEKKSTPEIQTYLFIYCLREALRWH